MPNEQPRLFKGVTISSTFTDLEEHRAALIKAIRGQSLADVAMENDSAKLMDVIESSLQMVCDGSAYIGIISHKYGQTPEDLRNPDRLSITELEFNEARRLERPILLFIMGDDHYSKPADVEKDPEKNKKLEAFRENAKRMRPDAAVHRVYKVFNNLHEFEVAATQSVADLRRHLDAHDQPIAQTPPVIVPEPIEVPAKPDAIPAPPAFYAEPRYIGTHKFVGRRAQLDTLNDWATAADPHPVLLFEAIGGTGKSMLTWEWVTQHSTNVRTDWAGRFWYSFYERGAVMADFCQRALAYITGEPFENFRKKKTLELSELLLRHLQREPWLLVLDWLERVLVAYHRFDAAQLRDEEADTAGDQIAKRDPCAAIRPEDDELLRALAAATPSKLLLTSRLTPRVLLNQSHQGIPGVRRELLPGLRPADAEALLRACGITGDSATMQHYLTRHCDCHPLVTGVLAGLIHDYLPDRGNFDAWEADAQHGGHLNLAELDLVQKRNHILKAALIALPDKSRALLSTLALLSEAVDYPTLSALNPHLPPEPEEVEEPEKPEDEWDWDELSAKEKKKAQRVYQAALKRRKEYEQSLKARMESVEYRTAPQKLPPIIRDLEQRGMLQYDAQTKRYDMHPVVRGMAAGELRQEEKEQYGQRVVDHFSQQAHSPYDEAETLEDLRDGLLLVRTLLQMGRHQQAFDAYSDDLSNALLFNVEAHSETLSLLHPFFPHGWAMLPADLDEVDSGYLVIDVANALSELGELEGARVAYDIHLLSSLRHGLWFALRNDLHNLSLLFNDQNHMAMQERSLNLSFDLATELNNAKELFIARHNRFGQLTELGRWNEAEAIWQLLNPMGRKWPRGLYRPGDAEFGYATLQWCRGSLQETHLVEAEQLAQSGKSRSTIRALHCLRGEWRLQQGQWALTANSFQEAVRMAREVGQTDTGAETCLALAKFHLNQLTEPRLEAERLAQFKKPSDRYLAELWLVLGDREQAVKHALAAYEWAWADGEPYVHRYELTKTTELLQRLGATIPTLPPYDPTKHEKFPWEDDVIAAIEKLRAENEAKQREQAEADAPPPD